MKILKIAIVGLLGLVPINANVFEYKNTANQAVTAVARAKGSKKPSKKPSAAPREARMFPNQVTMKIVGEQKQSLERPAIPARSQVPIRRSSQALTRVQTRV
jgi:hypothetical protein